MTSTGYSSHGGIKRKRPVESAASSIILHQANLPSTMEPQLQQAESRDASGENGDTTAPDSIGVPSQSLALRKADSNVSQHPPKRHRSDTAPEDAADPGEPSDATEASTDIADRVSQKTVLHAKAASNNVAVQEDKERFPSPPIGKLLHPVGYRTNLPPAGRPVRVYADGVFDLFHLGHMRQLQQAKMAFPDVYLLVGVTCDEETHKRKGITVLSGKDRAETVRHCKWVDEVIENCPWIVTPDFLTQHKIDYVAHDDLPYGAAEGDDIYAPIKEQGKFLVTQRTEGVSTTGIITKIVRDYEKYIARQLKRGTTRQELNLSWLKKNELELKRHVQDLRDNIRSNWSSTGQELGRELRQFWPSSTPQSPARSIFSTNATASPATANGSDGISSSLPVSMMGSRSPGAEGRTTNDFIAGYTMGLIGGVRSWMTRSRRSPRPESRPLSDDESDHDRQRQSTTTADSTSASAPAATAS